MDFTDKVAIVTGSSQGIGRETGRQLLELGANVVFVARNKKKLEFLEREIGSEHALFLSLDLSHEGDCRRMVNRVVKKFGGIDILINNVGRGFRGQLIDTDIKMFNEVMAVNLMSAVYCTKYAAKELIKSKGSLVFISSMSGIRGIPCYGPYSISKCGVNTFSEILNIELGRQGVHVGTMVFGPVEAESRKKYISAKGTRNFLKEPRSFISMSSAAKKIIKCIRKRKSIMYVTWLSKMMFYMNRISPRFVRFLLKHFRCPEDYQ